MKNFDTGKNSINTGIIIKIDPASNGPHSIYCSAIKVANPKTVVFFMLSLIITSANIYSPHAVIKESAPIIIMPGEASGKTILIKAVIPLAPSICADSSNSLGIVSKNDTRSQVQKGATRAV
ncbi:hypothetical protein ES703_37627 [subsurface metagenome]